jgi:hypothetical protein
MNYKFAIYTKPSFEQTSQFFPIHYSKTKKTCVGICLREIPYTWECFIFDMKNGKKYDKYGKLMK